MEKLYQNKEWLENEYINNKKGCQIIGEMFDVHMATIFYFLKKFDIPTRTLAQGNTAAKEKHCFVSSRLKEHIDGMLLSDGHMGDYKSGSFFCLGMLYKDAPEFYYNLFVKNNIKSILRFRKYLSKGKELKQWYIKSNSYVEFKDIYNKWYKDKIKIIPKDLTLSPVMLYWWMIGDGCNQIKNGEHYITLHTECFTIEEIEFLQDLIRKYFNNTNTSVVRSYGKQFHIAIRKGLFFDFINECEKSKIELESYKYKLIKEKQ